MRMLVSHFQKEGSYKLILIIIKDFISILFSISEHLLPVNLHGILSYIVAVKSKTFTHKNV